MLHSELCCLFLPFLCAHPLSDLSQYLPLAQTKAITVSGQGQFNALISAGLRLQSAAHQIPALLKLMIRRIPSTSPKEGFRRGRACRLALKKKKKGILKVQSIFKFTFKYLYIDIFNSFIGIYCQSLS